MASMIEDIMGQLGEGGIGQIAGALGVDASEGSSLISSALPALLGGLANNTQSDDGAASLLGALDQHSSPLDLGALLGGDGVDGGKILGHVLGSNTDSVVNHLSGGNEQKSGLLMKLLPILAPIVMNYLFNKRSTGGLDAGGLGGMLGAEAKSAHAGAPDLGGLFDLIGGGGGGGLGSILGSVLGGSSDGGGGLGDVIGDVLGGVTDAASGATASAGDAATGAADAAKGGLGDIGDIAKDVLGEAADQGTQAKGGLMGMLKKMLGGK